MMLVSNPYLGQNEQIPCYPHLIVVAGTLLSQWESELKILIKPQTFDIFTYGSGKKFHQNFWSPVGPFHSSRQPMSRRIIIASYTVHIHIINLCGADTTENIGHSARLQFGVFL